MKTKCIASTLVAFVAFVGLRALPQNAENRVPDHLTVVEFGTNGYGYGRANGRYWKQLQPQSKNELIYGYEEGITLLARETSAKAKPEVATRTQQIADSLMISGFRSSDLVKQVDELYADTANLRIPVIDAYVYSLLKIRGATNQELDALVVGMRRKYNK